MNAIVEEIMSKLHKNSLLKYRDIIKITRKLTKSIFGKECSVYSTKSMKKIIPYSFLFTDSNNRHYSRSISLIEYLFQSINSNMPKINNISYKKVCETKNCINYTHYEPHHSNIKKYAHNVPNSEEKKQYEPKSLTISFL